MSFDAGPTASPSRLLAGTSGYSFKEWVGPFYPPKTSADDMLRLYASKLPTVEINNTFYRMPDPAVLDRWRVETPDGFAFALKAPKRITHSKRLADAVPDVTELMRRAASLGDKLGSVLFQLPPFQRKDLPLLDDFLARLPDGTRAAFEFRHPSWLDDAVYATLRARGAMLCVADTDKGETPFVATANCGYVRLRRTHYEDGELRDWAARIASQGLPCTYVYFMHEDDALGTRFALRLLDAWRQIGGPAPAQDP